MEYRTLGRSGAAVSSLALGTMTFGRETSESDSHEQLDVFTEAGGTLIDTADVYAQTESEAIIGRWLAKAPVEVTSQLLIATKGRFPTGDGPNDLGNSRRHLSTALDASLRRLQIETIDLYQVHGFDPLTPIEETLRFIDDAVSAGKIRYFGLSNFLSFQQQKAIDIAEFRGWTRPVTLQPQYNLLAREIEWESVPACLAEGLSILTWSPLAGGWLTGKYARGERPTGATRLGENPDVGVEAYDRRAVERTWNVVHAVGEIAVAQGASSAQVALAWLLSKPVVASVILGARTTKQLRDNLGAVDVYLTADQLSHLDEISAPLTPDYPYGEPGMGQRLRKVNGGR